MESSVSTGETVVKSIDPMRCSFLLVTLLVETGASINDKNDGSISSAYIVVLVDGSPRFH